MFTRPVHYTCIFGLCHKADWKVKVMCIEVFQTTVIFFLFKAECMELNLRSQLYSRWSSPPPPTHTHTHTHTHTVTHTSSCSPNMANSSVSGKCPTVRTAGCYILSRKAVWPTHLHEQEGGKNMLNALIALAANVAWKLFLDGPQEIYW